MINIMKKINLKKDCCDIDKWFLNQSSLEKQSREECASISSDAFHFYQQLQLLLFVLFVILLTQLKA